MILFSKTFHPHLKSWARDVFSSSSWHIMSSSDGLIGSTWRSPKIPRWLPTRLDLLNAIKMVIWLSDPPDLHSCLLTEVYIKALLQVAIEWLTVDHSSAWKLCSAGWISKSGMEKANKYPTIKLFLKDDKSHPIEFTGEKELKDFVAFIQKHIPLVKDEL